MTVDEQKVQAKIATLDSEELLDQVTAYRLAMEPSAVSLMEKELRKRGINAAKIAEHRESCERECIYLADGTAAMCSFCRKPAVQAGWGWHRLWGIMPILPRRLRRCKAHVEK
jgi:hypothetical protein